MPYPLFMEFGQATFTVVAGSADPFVEAAKGLLISDIYEKWVADDLLAMWEEELAANGLSFVWDEIDPVKALAQEWVALVKKMVAVTDEEALVMVPGRSFVLSRM